MSHIQSIGLNNFRVFKGETTFSFAPITVLTGANNAGKSSLLKSFLLLKDNFQKGFLFEKLDFRGNSHFLGEFKNCINNESETIDFIFPIKMNHLPDKNWQLRLYFEQSKNAKAEYGELATISIYKKEELHPLIKINIGEEIISNFNRTRATELQINLKYLFSFINEEISKRNKKTKSSGFSLGRRLTLEESQKNEIIRYQHEEKIKEEVILRNKLYKESFCTKIKKQKIRLKLSVVAQETYKLKIIEKLKLFIGSIEKLTLEESEIWNQVIDEFSTGQLPDLNFGFSNYDFYNHELSYPLDMEYYTGSHFQYIENIFSKNSLNIDYILSSALQKKITGEIKIEHIDSFEELGKLIEQPVINQLQEIQSIFVKSFFHLTSVRGNIERTHKNKAINSSFGKLLLDFYELNLAVDSIEQKFINNWLQEFKIAEKLEVERYAADVSNIYLIKNGKRMLLADVGYGNTQFIPILLQIAIQAKSRYYSGPDYYYSGLVLDTIRYSPSILFIEEPEANLHPKLQSKLADLFIDAADRFNIQFILESHSEYMVRRFQYWVAKQTIKAEDIALHYLNSGSTTVPTLLKIDLDDEGNLKKKFPRGFYDEATTLEDDIKKEQKLIEKEKERASLNIKANNLQSTLERQNILSKVRCVFFTEDNDYRMLKALLESNRFNIEETHIIPYHRKNHLKEALYMGKKITSSIKDAFKNASSFIYHMDSDIRSQETLDSVLKKAFDRESNHALFFTDYYDLEAYFLNLSHIHNCFPNISKIELETKINELTEVEKETSIDKIAESYKIRDKSLSFSVKAKNYTELYESNSIRYRYSKNIFESLVEFIKIKEGLLDKKTVEEKLFKKSDFLKVTRLEDLAKTIWAT